MGRKGIDRLFNEKKRWKVDFREEVCHNVVELVKSNTKYCCRQPDIVGDN